MARKDKEFDETMLPGLLAHEIEAAMRVDGSDESKRRTENIEYLRGEMNDVNPRPNGSKVTSRDTGDTISWMLPGLMRIFTASDRMAVFEPEEEADDEYVEQATDYANYVFFRDNDGYKVLRDAAYDALGVSGDGIVKHWWDETPVTKVLTYTGVTAVQLAGMEADEEFNILTSDPEEPQTIKGTDEFGQPIETVVETYSVKGEHIRLNGKIRVECIEPENFLINEEATDIDEFRFCAHRDPRMTKSMLLEMGFDREKVEQLSTDSRFIDSEEALSRNDNKAQGLTHALQDSQQHVDFYECYIRIDADGDGISETIKVSYAGHGNSGVVLDWEVWEDDVPFSKIPCYPRAHEFTSENVADRTKDIQRLRTVFWRAINDNLVASSLPQTEVDLNSVLNPDVLTNPRFGSVIWKKPASADIRRHEIPFAADKMFPAMELLDGIIEKRTGVSRTMMALDPEALQNQTATASQNARDASYSQIELIARDMAEGWRKVFRAIHKLIVQHQDRPRMIRLRDEFVTIDPRVWNADMDCTINIGLGTGSRDRDLSMLMVILQQQKETVAGLYEAGATEEAIEMLPKITETLNKITEASGIKNPEAYWPQFDEQAVEKLKQQAAQPRPDPQVELEREKMQMQAQLEQQKLEMNAKAEELKAQGNAVKEQAQMEADLQVKAAERENELVIANQNAAWEREKFTAELQFKYAELAMKREAEDKRAEAAKAKQNKSEGEAA